MRVVGRTSGGQINNEGGANQREKGKNKKGLHSKREIVDNFITENVKQQEFDENGFGKSYIGGNCGLKKDGNIKRKFANFFYNIIWDM